MRIGAWRRKRCAEPLCRRGLPCGAAVPPCGSPRALPRGFPRGICPCVAPLPCGSVCIAALFHAGGGIALRGACLLHLRAEPGRHLQPQQKRYPAGGLALFAACLPCPSGSRRGLGGFGRLPALPLACFAAPIPPAPFPSGEGGEIIVFLCKGLRPLHPRELNPGGTYSPNKKGTRRGACLVCRLPTMPLVYFLSPIPPAPFPSGEGGD